LANMEGRSGASKRARAGARAVPANTAGKAYFFFAAAAWAASRFARFA
jgi:hypothetical protein